MFSERLSHLYDLATGDDDTRVCKDIPERACRHLPRNFFAYLGSNVCTKVGDELCSARVIMPWLLSQLGSSATLVGFIVPIREAGVLLPQLFVAAAIRNLAQRKYAWLVGALICALALFALAVFAQVFTGQRAAAFILFAFVIYSLARGICSVAAKDVLGKTVSKSRRGALMGYAASASSVVILLLGIALQFAPEMFDVEPGAIAALLFLLAGALWLMGAGCFMAIKELPGASEGGGNAITEAFASLSVVVTDAGFRRYLIARALLLSLALMPPFVVLAMQQQTDGFALGFLVIVNGLAGAVSGVIWGKVSDRSSRFTMAIAAFGSAAAGVLFWLLNNTGLWLSLSLFFVVCIGHAGARLGRKTYLVDMANADNRARFVAVGNTLIGLTMLASGAVGALADIYSPALTVLALSVIAGAAGVYCLTLENVSLD